MRKIIVAFIPEKDFHLIDVRMVFLVRLTFLFHFSKYRMHPEICRFPSMHFYGDKLSNGLEMVSKSAPFHETSILGPYMFFDVTDGRENHGKGNSSQSLYNESEADMAVEIVKFLKKRYSSVSLSRTAPLLFSARPLQF